MKSQRQSQYGETIKRIIADIFLRGDVVSFSGSYVTVLEADVSPDIKNAKIFIDIFGGEANHQKIIEKLNEMGPQFRFQLSKKLTSRGVPELTFILDKTQDKAMKIEDIISSEAKKLEKPTKKKPSRK